MNKKKVTVTLATAIALSGLAMIALLVKTIADMVSKVMHPIIWRKK